MLLARDEPAAFRVLGEKGASPFVLACDHAGARVPRRLDALGLAEEDLARHIAWDIGAAAVAERLAAHLDAYLILQTYSRLVIDCNRPLRSPQSIVALSESTRIPGNESVSPGDVLARQREVFQPYHDRLAAELDQRRARRQPAILVAVHSFTPCFHGHQRPWHAGLLYNRDGRLAQALLGALRAETGLVVGDNEPYSVTDSTDYTIPVHGERRGLLHVGIEVRQDLIVDEVGQNEWAERLAHALLVAGEVAR